MSTNILLNDVLTWSNPLTYFFIMVLFVMLRSVRIIINANRILKDGGVELSYNLFGNRFANMFRWTSVHQTKTGVIMILIVLLGIIAALRFGA